jgi:hypothetical protein
MVYGILNAILYASLLPLWDGWDEPFHYGYVQRLSHRGDFPVLRQTMISSEIKQSMLLVPASHLVKRNLPFVTAFDEYFRKPAAERVALREQLERLSPDTASVDSDTFNYEAQQAPLAYLLLAPVDLLVSRVTLLHRALLLRLICGIVSVVATGLLTVELAGMLGLPEIFRVAALFLVLSSQVFYASTAHIANDWLAIPLFTWVVIRSIRFYQTPGTRNALLFAAALGAGLLTKAYFLSLVPFAGGCLVAMAWRRKVHWRPAVWFCAGLGAIAAPWYARNLWLYQDLSGMQETTGGAPLGVLASAAWRLPWGEALMTMLRATLWSGNNSSNTFSSTILGGMIVLLAGALGLYVVQRFRQRVSTVENIVIVAVLAFSVGLAYKGVVTFWATSGVGLIPAQWYVEALAPAVLCLMVAGLARSGRVGRVVGVAMLWLWFYVMCATYVAKLIPFYSGYPEGSVRLVALMRWYGNWFAESSGKLTLTAMVSAGPIVVMTAAVIAIGLVIAVRVSMGIWTMPQVRQM